MSEISAEYMRDTLALKDVTDVGGEGWAYMVHRLHVIVILAADSQVPTTLCSLFLPVFFVVLCDARRSTPSWPRA